PAEPGCGKSPGVWACTTWRTWAAARCADADPKAGFQARLYFTLPETLGRGLIWQDGVRTGPSSRERTWPSSSPGCQTAAGSWLSRSWLIGRMAGKRPEKGPKWRLWKEYAT